MERDMEIIELDNRMPAPTRDANSHARPTIRPPALDVRRGPTPSGAPPPAIETIVGAIDRGHRPTPTIVASLVYELKAPHDEGVLLRIVDALLVCDLTPYQRSSVFDAAHRLAKSPNAFVSYRGCVQMQRLGQRDLRFENTAALTLMLVASRAGGALARRIDALLD